MHFPVILGLFSLPLVILASPILSARNESNVESIDQALFSTIQLYAEYAGASYCPSNIDPSLPNGPIICLTTRPFNCNRVEVSAQRTLLKFENQGVSGVTGFVAIDRTSRLIVVSFRGTQTILELVTDLDLGLGAADDICPGCRAHTGYLRSWQDSRQAIITTVQEALAVPGQEGFRVVTTGHSLGAGIASVAGLALRGLGMNVDIAVYASSRVGNQAFASAVESTFNANNLNLRILHQGDPLPDNPATNLELNGRYRHFLPAYQITTPTNTFVTDGTPFTLVTTQEFTNSRFSSIISDQNAHNWYLNEISGCGPASVSAVATLPENRPLLVNQIQRLRNMFGRANPLFSLTLRAFLYVYGIDPATM